MSGDWTGTLIATAIMAPFVGFSLGVSWERRRQADMELVKRLRADVAVVNERWRRAITTLSGLIADYQATNPTATPWTPEWFDGLEKFWKARVQ